MQDDDVRAMKINKNAIMNNYDEITSNKISIKYNNYTQKEIENIQSSKIKIANNEQDVINFIENAKKMSSNLKLYFGKITTPVSSTINDLYRL